MFWQTHVVPCCLQELWICYDTKRFSFSPTLMLLTVIALYSVYLFVCQKVKISRGKLRARNFLRWLSPSVQDENFEISVLNKRLRETI